MTDAELKRLNRVTKAIIAAWPADMKPLNRGIAKQLAEAALQAADA